MQSHLQKQSQEKERVNEYVRLMKLMVDDYRMGWRKKLPFYFVQLSSIDTLQYKGQHWPEFRNAQRTALELIEDSGMAVCSDIGSPHDVHPRNKKDVGERLALWALRKTYKKKLAFSGPLPLKATYARRRVVVTYRYAKGLRPSVGKEILGFSLDGKNETTAVRRGRKIIIVATEKPAHIYYGWKPFSNANLVNKQMLPASTFKIDVR